MQDSLSVFPPLQRTTQTAKSSHRKTQGDGPCTGREQSSSCSPPSLPTARNTAAAVAGELRVTRAPQLQPQRDTCSQSWLSSMATLINWMVKVSNWRNGGTFCIGNTTTSRQPGDDLILQRPDSTAPGRSSELHQDPCSAEVKRRATCGFAGGDPMPSGSCRGSPSPGTAVKGRGLRRPDQKAIFTFSLKLKK